jgi:multiple sugar transport system substrate-binding protein
VSGFAEFSVVSQASLVPITNYRPAYAVYPRISNEIQVATESVITGSADVAAAAANYDNQVRTIAGDADVAAAGS